MEILIRGSKIKVTKSIKDYANQKLARLEKYFNDKDIKCSVNIKVKDNKQIIEVTIPTPKFTLRAEEQNKDLYAAIDLVIDKLERQIRKNKTKINNKYKNIEIINYINEEIDTDVDEETQKIVKRKNIEIMPMDEEEAILQLELIDHDFFIFKNIDEECISVLYKRKEGEYGIINTK